MTSLEDNVFNRTRLQNEPKFKLWTSAGLMLTYRCPSRCACCYVFSGPEAGSKATEMTVEMALDVWQAVRRLAPQQGRVHITGGEPFDDYPRLLKILQQACDQRLEGLEKIETNAYWCTDPEIVRQRLSQLRDLGLTKLQVSTDIYHQEFVPIERVELAVSVAREVLGEKGVQVRWRDFLAQPVLTENMTPQRRRQAWSRALARKKERLLGRGAQELANLFTPKTYDSFAGHDCWSSLLGSRHVHVDGAGNVFSGTCVGIIVDRVSPDRPLDAIWRQFDYREHPVISVLAQHGPMGLLGIAEGMGYRPLAAYGSKCHLCYDVRRFLLPRTQYCRFLGPDTCYGV